jgi:hypothetical protein
MGKLQAPILADRIERWPVERLKPYDKNPRTHSAEQLAQLKRSIAEFGFTNPILVDGKDGILAGHGRLMAAKDMGLAEVPVLVLDHLTPEQRRAYVIADNQLALNAGWDMELLQQEVASLNLQDFDLDLLGFDDEFLESLLDPDGIDNDEDGDGNSDNPYTDKTDVPPYEVTGPKPEIVDLYDDDKARKLIDAINGSDLPEHEKAFLRAAAYRHVVFNFQQVAEYYAHSSADVQQLMENSALVIVDIGKAIEEGWARLSGELDSAYEQDHREEEQDA